MDALQQELAGLRATLKLITGDLDAMLREAAEADTSPIEPEPVEEADQGWHSC